MGRVEESTTGSASWEFRFVEDLSDLGVNEGLEGKDGEKYAGGVPSTCRQHCGGECRCGAYLRLWE